MRLPSALLVIAITLIRTTSPYEPCEGELCPPKSLKPRTPSVDDYAPNYLGRDVASGCMCREQPHRFVVCFGRQLCQRIPVGINITTPVLKIIGTHITELRPGDFDLLPHLEALIIDENYNLSRILPGAFDSNLTLLTNMSLSYNSRLKTLYPESFQGLVNLRQLHLVKNGFEHVIDVTLALSPDVLPKLTVLSLNENNFVNVTNEDFGPMENSTLEEVNLVLCRLEYLEPDCFSPLRNLQVLRLGENRFDSSAISDVIARTVDLGIPLKVLNLFSAGFRISPPRKLMGSIARSNITHLNLARNQFEVISKGMFPVAPNLRELDLRDVLASDIEPEAFYNLPNLKTLLLSGNKLQSVPVDAVRSNLTYLDLQQNSGNKFYSSYLCIKNGRFANMTHLIYLNLNFNRVKLLFNTSFTGLANLRVLSLRNATVYNIQNDSFASLKNLEFLDLQNNFFVTNNYPIGIEQDTFKGLENLKVLLMGGCGITYFSKYGNPFVHLKNLVHLGLERNEIASFSPTDFAPLVHLQVIDVSENRMIAWHDRIFSRNSELRTVILNKNKIISLSPAMLDDFANLSEVDLEINPLSCDCRTFHIFNDWSMNYKGIIHSSTVKGRCTFPDYAHNYSVLEYFEGVRNGTVVCGPKLISKLFVVLPVVLLLAVFIILGILVYYYRWHVRYWIFLTRLHLSRTGRTKPKPEKSGYNNYTYDAFVSYSNEDRNFVVRLVSMLENYEPFLKLCVYDRDFEIGAMISESILESVAKSRKTLLIISDSYAKSVWCRWESQLAEHHKLFFEDRNGKYVDDTLILVKLGPVNANHLTPTLRYLLKTRIYLQWEVEEKKQKVFWEKLRNALAPPKNEQVILENTHM